MDLELSTTEIARVVLFIQFLDRIFYRFWRILRTQKYMLISAINIRFCSNLSYFVKWISNNIKSSVYDIWPKRLMMNSALVRNSTAFKKWLKLQQCNSQPCSVQYFINNMKLQYLCIHCYLINYYSKARAIWEAEIVK